MNKSVDLCYNPKSKKLWKYEIEDENFAAGCFGKIILAKDPNSNKQVVIKKIPKDYESSTEVVKEIEAGKKLKHKNISKFQEHFANRDFDYLVFDRVQGSDLFSLIEKRKFTPFTDSETRKIFKQILKAVRYAHKHDIVHRDIKLENILMDSQKKITLIDFGLCDIVKRGTQSERFCGSIDYVAPEVLLKKSYDGFTADCFSLGVVLYTLLFAEFPFVSKERVQALKAGLESPKPIFSETKIKKWNVSPLAKDLICKMLRTKPEGRITLEEVKNHPWLKKKTITLW